MRETDSLPDSTDNEEFNTTGLYSPDKITRKEGLLIWQQPESGGDNAFYYLKDRTVLERLESHPTSGDSYPIRVLDLHKLTNKQLNMLREPDDFHKLREDLTPIFNDLLLEDYLEENAGIQQDITNIFDDLGVNSQNDQGKLCFNTFCTIQLTPITYESGVLVWQQPETKSVRRMDPVSGREVEEEEAVPDHFYYLGDRSTLEQLDSNPETRSAGPIKVLDLINLTEDQLAILRNPQDSQKLRADLVEIYSRGKRATTAFIQPLIEKEAVPSHLPRAPEGGAVSQDAGVVSGSVTDPSRPQNAAKKITSAEMNEKDASVLKGKIDNIFRDLGVPSVGYATHGSDNAALGNRRQPQPVLMSDESFINRVVNLLDPGNTSYLARRWLSVREELDIRSRRPPSNAPSLWRLASDTNDLALHDVLLQKLIETEKEYGTQEIDAYYAIKRALLKFSLISCLSPQATKNLIRLRENSALQSTMWLQGKKYMDVNLAELIDISPGVWPELAESTQGSRIAVEQYLEQNDFFNLQAVQRDDARIHAENIVFDGVKMSRLNHTNMDLTHAGFNFRENGSIGHSRLEGNWRGARFIGLPGGARSQHSPHIYNSNIGGNLSGAQFRNIVITKSRIKGDLSQARFKMCDLSTTDFRGSDLRTAQFVHCTLPPASAFKDTIFSGRKINTSGESNYMFLQVMNRVKTPVDKVRALLKDYVDYSASRKQRVGGFFGMTSKNKMGGLLHIGSIQTVLDDGTKQTPTEIIQGCIDTLNGHMKKTNSKDALVTRLNLLIDQFCGAETATLRGNIDDAITRSAADGATPSPRS